MFSLARVRVGRDFADRLKDVLVGPVVRCALLGVGAERLVLNADVRDSVPSSARAVLAVNSRPKLDLRESW